jgi:hypothetical protein
LESGFLTLIQSFELKFSQASVCVCRGKYFATATSGPLR